VLPDLGVLVRDAHPSRDVSLHTHQFKEAAPETPVIFTVHELKLLARNAAELMTLSAELQAGGIQPELLTGPLTGIYDPNGMGAMRQRHGAALVAHRSGVTVNRTDTGCPVGPQGRDSAGPAAQDGSIRG
jgi:hypothetical protein